MIKWKIEDWLKMLEMLLGIMIFGLHSVASAWWRPFDGKVIPLMKSTGLCSPLIPQMFRTGSYFYRSEELVKPVNLFVMAYCFVSYFAGCLLLISEAISSSSRIVSKNVDLFTAFVAAVLALLYFVDVVLAVKE
ncbi:uncharacterized protein LOC106665186 [Cimex lectularius]|uniref:Uncharacterized protein n=1 Tax=Cimex lectularius TaxID=79782 RepID=A0A8I6RIG0_CIMLE|nr:uncharacterized protein LOC106665186 [Cimex lectularius]